MNNKLNPALLASTTAITIALFTGCLGSALTPETSTATPTEKKIVNVSDTDKSISKLNTRIVKMKKENIVFFAPNTYAAIKDKYDNILTYRSDSSRKTELSQDIAATDKLIDTAYSRKKVLTQKLSDLLEHLNTLKSLKSDTHYPDRFNSLKDEMLDIISSYDKTAGLFSDGEANIGALDDTEALSQEMTQLEIDTVLKIEYTPNEVRFNTMSDNDFIEFAPLSFANAQKQLTALHRYIIANHLNTQGIAERKRASTFELDHLDHVYKEVNKLIVENNYEKIILNQENKYLDLMSKFSLGDKRDKALNTQYDLLLSGIEDMRKSSTDSDFKNAEKIEVLKNDIKNKEQEIALLTKEIEELKANSEKLNMKIEATATELKLANEKIQKMNLENETRIANNKKQAKANLDSSNRVVSDLNAKIVNLKKVNTVNKKKADAKLRSANREIKKLKVELKKAKTKKAKTKKEVVKVEEKVTPATSEAK